MEKASTREVEVIDHYVSKWVGNILHIYDWTYRQNYYYIRAKTHKEYREICEKELKCHIDIKQTETGGGFNVFEHGKDKTEVCYIWAADKRSLVHECFHAVSYTLRSRGIKLTDDSDEAFAYSLGFLFDEIIKNCRKRK
jgi:hypothetical protein